MVSVIDKNRRPEQLVENIKTRQDLVEFLEVLIADYKANSEDWENVTLENYLEAMASWIGSMDAVYKNTSRTLPANPGWQEFANMLLAATMYG